MPKSKEAVQEQLLSMLRTAKNGLAYLTQNDWVLLTDRAKILTYRKGQVLIQEGKQTRVVYLVIQGKVGITVLGNRVAQITSGQICGEMAFLEDGLASATAIAEDEVQAYAIAWGALADLFELYPHLASRFYRSLAVNLSRRLREQLVSN